MSYLHAAKMCSPVLGGAVDIVLGADKAPVSLASPPPAGKPTAPVVASKSDLQKHYLIALGTAVGGALLWKKHRVLGFLAGGTVGDVGYRVYRNKGDDRKDAAFMAASQAVAVGASLQWKNHPALGYIGGMALANGVSYFVPGSPQKRYHEAMKAGTAPSALPGKK